MGSGGSESKTAGGETSAPSHDPNFKPQGNRRSGNEGRRHDGMLHEGYFSDLPQYADARKRAVKRVRALKHELKGKA